MNAFTHGAIDCDIHPGVPGIKALLPYMDDHWRDAFVLRGMDNFDLASYPPGAPISCRPDWRPPQGKPGTDIALLQSHALDHFGTRYAVCNPLYGGHAVVSPTMGAAICSATNDWIETEWLARDARLRASIVVPAQDPELCVAEIAQTHRMQIKHYSVGGRKSRSQPVVDLLRLREEFQVLLEQCELSLFHPIGGSHRPEQRHAVFIDLADALRSRLVFHSRLQLRERQATWKDAYFPRRDVS